MKTSFLNDTELSLLGLNSYGKNVLVSRKASLYAAELISLGDNVRIDDFCVISGYVSVGSHVHISAFTGLWGGVVGIKMDDYSGISSHCSIYAISDDYSGHFLSNAMCPSSARNVKAAEVRIGKYVQLGAGSVVLPGINIPEGAVIGAMSFVTTNPKEWSVNGGIPCKWIKERSRDCIKLTAHL